MRTISPPQDTKFLTWGFVKKFTSEAKKAKRKIGKTLSDFNFGDKPLERIKRIPALLDHPDSR